MKLTAFAVENKTVTYFVAFLLLVAGIASFFNLGQLEDPDFSIKTAVVVTRYPGASPEEVELEVTDRIERRLQEMPQIDYLRSFSRAGLSWIEIHIKQEYWSDRLPQVWDELRRRIRDIEQALPPGAGRPIVNDDFGDVFGHLLALVGDGFSYAELENYAEHFQREISLIPGVARVDLWGVQQQVIYLDTSETQLAALGLSDASIEQTLQLQNAVVDAGGVDVQNKRFRMAPTGGFQSPDDIADLTIRPSFTDSLQNRLTDDGAARASELIHIRDIGTVRRGYREPPATLMRFNGRPAIGLAISNMSGVNIVDMGHAVDARLQELMAELPVGLEALRVHWQSDVVAEAINGFLISFAQAVLIVLVVLTIGMGWRLAVIIGMALIGTILGSFLIMAIFEMDLERMSLGALIIALGMMVDNAIVVADGFVVRLQRGMDRTRAAIEAGGQPAIPLLGATIVAVMAFYPIFASTQNTGEYCGSLFTVAAISLLVSWLISVTITPVQCLDMLPTPPGTGEATDPYAGGLFRRFRGLLEWAIRFRFLTIGTMVGLLVLSVIGFGAVKQLFFPDSSMAKFMIDYRGPEGTRIQQISADIKAIEAKLLADDRVEAVAAFVGAGPPRFYLPVQPENPNAAYAQLIVNVHDFRDIDALVQELNVWLAEAYPQALVPVRKYGVGPSNTWRFEVRLSGPGTASPATLRALAAHTQEVLAASPLAGVYQTDWRQRAPKMVPEFNQARGRWAGVTRDNVADATKRAFDGRTIGLYREGKDLIPIVLRHVEEERQRVDGIDVLQVQPAGATHTVPLAQVTDGVHVAWEDPLIWRRDRRRTITVQGNPIFGVTLPTLRERVADAVESLELPPGYTMEWGGEYEDTVDAQAGLIPGVIPAVAIMVLIVVALFNALRPPLIIFMVIPFIIIGITPGLLVTGAAFGFVALLGAMSLSGMMIKNAVVLLDEVNLNLAAGMIPYEAVVQAALSRLRPVGLAAATTVLGVIPLLPDQFWVGLAVTIMAGLTVGTILTMVLVPVFYATLYRLRAPQAIE
jgi:multidrug efflux pump subunit AcrB